MYEESEIKDILQRAIEIDSVRSGQLSGSELRAIAAELGISEPALEQALTEREHTAAVPGLSKTPQMLSPLRVLNLSTGAGVVFGLLTSQPAGLLALGYGPLALYLSPVLAAGTLAMVSGALALSDRTRSALGFMARNAALWTGVGTGVVLAGALIEKFGPLASPSLGTVLERTVTFTFAGAALTTLVGTALRAIRYAVAPANAEAGQPPADNGGSGFISAIGRRVLRTLKRWSEPVRFSPASLSFFGRRTSGSH